MLVEGSRPTTEEEKLNTVVYRHYNPALNEQGLPDVISDLVLVLIFFLFFFSMHFFSVYFSYSSYQIQNISWCLLSVCVLSAFLWQSNGWIFLLSFFYIYFICQVFLTSSSSGRGMVKVLEELRKISGAKAQPSTKSIVNVNIQTSTWQ